MSEASNAPYIHAGQLSPEELREWLNQLANSAGKHNNNLSSIALRVTGLVSDAKTIEPTLTNKITFLSSQKIIRSAEHSTVIQEDLHLLRGIEQSIHDFLQSIEPLLRLFSENQEMKTSQEQKSEGLKSSELTMQGVGSNHSAAVSHRSKANE